MEDKNKCLTSDNLRRLQLTQLEILKEFDLYCRENGFKYQLFAGTLLGAIRHEGFIPWDDDIDVCMLRKDYDNFIKKATNDFNSQYFIQNSSTDKNFVKSFTRIRKNKTLALQQGWQHIDMHHGIFIDVFPLDNVEPETKKGKRQIRLLYRFRRIKEVRLANYKERKQNLKRKIAKMLQNIMSIISIEKFISIENKIMQIFSDVKTNKVTHLSEGDLDCYYKFLTDKDDFYKIIDYKFEDSQFMIPKNYDEILKNIFGSYHRYPPEREQVPHHGIVKLKF